MSAKDHVSLHRNSRRAFTLVELLVVIAIVGILIALLLPAVQAAREASRRASCSNNLHQVGIALHNYHDVYRTFPIGGAYGKGYGHSWWLRVLPYIEEGNIYQKFDQLSNNDGWLGANPKNYQTLQGIQFNFMYCPSTPVPPLTENRPEGYYWTTTNIATPSYTGIAGAVDHSTVRDSKGSYDGKQYGKISLGGVFLVGPAIALKKISDGSSKTMMVGEQSDWCIDAGGRAWDCRSDCGHGFCMGPGADQFDRTFNMTTVLYGLNDKEYSTVKHVGGNCATNSAIQSAHPGGAHVLMADSSVNFLAETIDLQSLYDLANRNDGHLTTGSF